MQANHELTPRRLSRRQLLRIGSVGSLNLTLPRLLQAEAEKPVRTSKIASRITRPIRSCILIFYYGGPSHIDTFDMKPNAPAEIRGQFSSIATNVPGFANLRALAKHRQGHGLAGSRSKRAPPDDES